MRRAGGLVGIATPRRASSTPARRCWSPTSTASGSGWADLARPALGGHRRTSSTRPRAACCATAGSSFARTTSSGSLAELDPARPAARPRSTDAARRRRFAVPLGLTHPRRRAPTRRPDRRRWAELARAGRAAGRTSREVGRGDRAEDRRPRLRRAPPERPRSRTLDRRGGRTSFEPPGPRTEADRRSLAEGRRRDRAGGRRQRDPRAGPRDRSRRPVPRCATRLAPSSSRWTLLEEDTQIVGRAARRVPRSSRSTLRHRRLRGPQPAADPVIGPRARGRPRPARAERRPARRPHPHPPARDRGDRGRRLQRLRRRLLRPRPPAHPGPGARRGRRRRCSRRTTSATPTRRSTRGGCSRPSWPPAHGSIRATRGGPNWSRARGRGDGARPVLVGGPARHGQPRPELRRPGRRSPASGGPNAGHAAVADPVPVTRHAAGTGGAQVVVRDGTGKVVFAGELRRRTAAHRAGVPAGADPVDRRVGQGDRGRAGPRAHGASGPSRPRQTYVVRR